MNERSSGASSAGRAPQARVRAALLALMLGGFGLGCSEFSAIGLLPNLAAELLPAVYSASPAEANAQAGWLITAYALGVVIGAPTIAVFATRLPRRRILLWLLAVFAAGTIATALAPNFAFALVARLIAALPHGAYFGIASLIAASLMGPGRRGRGVAFVLSGLPFSNLVGVPLLTWAGQSAGWRSAFLMVAAVFAVSFVAVRLLVPVQPRDPGNSMRGELRAFRLPQLWLVLAIGAIGFGGLFAVLTYVAPMTTVLAGLNEGSVPWVLVIAGLGMVAGNALAGRMADRGIERAMLLFFGTMLVSLVAMILFAGTPAGFVVTLFLLAASGFALAPVIQMRLMDVAGESQSLGAALNHSSLNVANAIGAALGSIVIAAGFGYLAPVAVAIALTAVGIALAIVSFRMERRG